MAPLSFDLATARGPAPPLASTSLRPRDWQRQLIQLLRARLPSAAGGSADVLVHAGPGAGKTLGALLAVQQLQAEGRLGGFVVFCHRSSIAGQWRAAAARLGLDLREWPDRGEQPRGHAGLLLSYQTASRQLERLRQEFDGLGAGQGWLAIADEVHHLGLDPEEPEATAWGHAFTLLCAGARLRLGLSGTPFRADNLAFCAARRLRVEVRGVVHERIVPDLCVEPRRLIVAGDVRPLEFRFQDGWVDHGRDPLAPERERSPLSTEQREGWRARNLRRAVRLGDRGGIALRVLLEARRRLERVRERHPQAGGLVIARDVAHAHRIAALLQEEGDAVLLAHSGDAEAGRRLADFRGGEADWLVSVDMCAEGFDAPRIRVVAYLSTKVTRSRFLQAITRAVRLDETRIPLEPVPRFPSTIVAPADPLLIAHARSWSLSEPYLVRPRGTEEPPQGAGGSHASLPLRALADDAGDLIRLSGPELPPFLRRSS
jgi:superfamily II DNA or RNA helicase